MSDEQAIAAVDKILGPAYKPEVEDSPEKVEYDLTQLKAANDDPSTMENFVMEDAAIPLNMRLLQTRDDDESSLYDNEDVPFNAKLLHIGNPEEGELVMVDQRWGFLKNIVNIDRFFDSGVRA
jgi:hypothetical protein